MKPIQITRINNIPGLVYGEDFCSLDGWAVSESKGDKWAIAETPEGWLRYYSFADGEDREIFPTLESALSDCGM